MAVETKELQAHEVEKQELEEVEGAERTVATKCFVPQVDIYETDEGIQLVADMPGVDENSVDVTLEKNVLTINGSVDFTAPEDYSLAFAEYEVGDFQRRFTLSNEIDLENIEASVKNGVLHLHLPKAGPAKAKKISVRAAV